MPKASTGSSAGSLLAATVDGRQALFCCQRGRPRPLRIRSRCSYCRSTRASRTAVTPCRAGDWSDTGPTLVFGPEGSHPFGPGGGVGGSSRQGGLPFRSEATHRIPRGAWRRLGLDACRRGRPITTRPVRASHDPRLCSANRRGERSHGGRAHRRGLGRSRSRCGGGIQATSSEMLGGYGVLLRADHPAKVR
jgi:hypothetical protein